jgi:replicative DNA helicase
MIEHEQVLLSTILHTEGRAYWNAAVTPGMFRDTRLREMYLLFKRIIESGGDVNLQTVGAALKSQAILSMNDLLDVSNAASVPSNLDFYVGEIRRTHELSVLKSAAADLLGELQNGRADAAGVLAEFDKRLVQLSQDGRGGNDHISSFADMWWSDFEERRSRGGGLSGLSTGLRKIDASIGGLEPGAVYLIGGRPGTGKSCVMMEMTLKISGQGAPVGFMSLEYSKESLERRMIANLSNLALRLIKEALVTDEQAERVRRAWEQVNRLPLLISDTSETIDTLKYRAKAWKRRHDIQCLFIDYLQLVRPVERMSSYEAVSETSREIKALAMDLKIPIVAGVQLNRQMETQNREPNLGDLRDSGQLEQDATAVILLDHVFKGKRKANIKAGNRRKMIVAKSRDGVSDVFTMLYFDGAVMRVGELDDLFDQQEEKDAG